MTSFYKCLLDWLYPPKCAICGAIGQPAVCSSCISEFHLVEKRRNDIPNLISAHYLFEYEGGAAEAVKRLKYGCITPLATPMAELIYKSANKLGLSETDLIVPVPIHWSRRFQRGFNQAELLCERLTAEIVIPQTLRRIRATRPQVGLSSEDRSRNIRNAFRASPAVSGKRVLLVDDVLTTGSTASECARTLLAAGAVQVRGLFFAGEELS